MIKHPSWLKLKSRLGTLHVYLIRTTASATIQNLIDGAPELGPIIC